MYSVSNSKSIDLPLKKLDQLSNQIGNELFDVFHWNKVVTRNHVAWKEYFHMLYDLIVFDITGDNAVDIILSRAVIQYHDVLKEPEMYEQTEVLIPTIHNLFKRLKEEHLHLFKLLKNFESDLQTVQINITEMQYKLVDFQQEVRRLEADNKKYHKIVRWSLQ